MSGWIGGLSPMQAALIAQTEAREERERQQRAAELAARAEDRLAQLAHSNAMVEKITGHSPAEWEQARAESREVREAMRAFAHLPYGDPGRPAIFIGDREITAAPEPAGSARRFDDLHAAQLAEVSRIARTNPMSARVRMWFAEAETGVRDYGGRHEYAYRQATLFEEDDPPPPPRRTITRYTGACVPAGDF